MRFYTTISPLIKLAILLVYLGLFISSNAQGLDGFQIKKPEKFRSNQKPLSHIGDLNSSQFPFHLAKEDTSIIMAKLYEINTFMEWYIKYFPIPFASYSTETSWRIGLSKYNAFKIRKRIFTDTLTMPSSISLSSYYTGKNQFKVVLQSNLMLNKNKAMWYSDFIYTYFPLEYYGVGNDTKQSDKQILENTYFRFQTELLLKTYEKIYIGPVIEYYDYFDVNIEEGSEINSDDSTRFAQGEGRQSGLGFKILREGRDNRLNGKHGTFLDISYKFFNEALGSERNYGELKADLRYYYTTANDLTIATQFRTESKSGDIPVQSLALLGGDYNMRGIYLGRYRDNVSIDAQTELRFPIYWIFGAVLFTGLGQVAPEYNSLQINKFHYVYGAGLRIKVDSENDVNMRFDVGRSKDRTMFIITFAEAF